MGLWWLALIRTEGGLYPTAAAVPMCGACGSHLCAREEEASTLRRTAENCRDSLLMLGLILDSTVGADLLRRRKRDRFREVGFGDAFRVNRVRVALAV